MINEIYNCLGSGHIPPMRHRDRHIKSGQGLNVALDLHTHELSLLHNCHWHWGNIRLSKASGAFVESVKYFGLRDLSMKINI